jgi:hypothetical protein
MEGNPSAFGIGLGNSYFKAGSPLHRTKNILPVLILQEALFKRRGLTV